MIDPSRRSSDKMDIDIQPDDGSLTSDPMPLPEEASRPLLLDDVETSVREAAERAPANGALQTAANSLQQSEIGPSTVGITAKALKEHFVKAWKEDAKINRIALRWLKRAGRVAGIVVGMTINLAARAASFALAAAVSPLLMGWYTVMALFKGKTSAIWTNPRETSSNIFAISIAYGAGFGAAIGLFGNLLINASLNLPTGKTTGEKFSKSFEDSIEQNAAAAMGGAAIGTLACFANPLLWRAAWTKDSGTMEDPSG